MTHIDDAQRAVCARFGVDAQAPEAGLKVGIAADVRNGGWPLNGLRYRPEHGTCGWYLWSGAELSTDDDYFSSLHVEHVASWRVELVLYLALPPGWGFVIAPGHEDVWFDEALLTP